MLLKAGFLSEPGKGSHPKWKHPLINRKIVRSIKIMKPKTEQILGTLELLVDKLSFNLPGHEHGGSIYPFVWEEVTQGKFNIFNLCQANNWLKLTDTDAVIKSWQQLEYARDFNAFTLTNTLQKTGMLEMSKFAGLYCDRQDLDDWYCDYNTNKIYQKYDRINQFMTRTFQEVIVYRLCNGIAEKIYFVGEINESDRAGIYLESYFVYNP